MSKTFIKTSPIIIVVLFAISAIATFIWWKNSLSPVSQDQTPTYFTIEKGTSAEEIGQKLYTKNLIRSPLAFKVYVQLSNNSQKINAGEFVLKKTMTIPEIIETLQGGPVELWVTVPEGLRKEEIVEIFVDSLQMDTENADFFREDFLTLAKEKEGYLFPDTYLFPPQVTAEIVVNKLTATFEEKLKSLNPVFDQLSKQQTVTLASIIERETKSFEERSVVAGILIKRLNTPGWLLQADASVQYAVANQKCITETCDNWWPILTLKDLEIDSPYNTYTQETLPPAPIANPGLESLKAALNPKHSNYWFYIHDPEGNIHYAQTLSQHNENISKYLGK
jgi:UPF0755 protein